MPFEGGSFPKPKCENVLWNRLEKALRKEPCGWAAAFGGP